MEAARRASLAEAEAHQIRASQIAVGASSSRTVEIAGGTTDGAVVAEDTTDGCPYCRGRGFRGIGPTILLIDGALRHKFASPTTLVFIFLCIGDNCMLFCWGGVNG